MGEVTINDVIVVIKDFLSGKNQDVDVLDAALEAYMNNTHEYRMNNAQYLENEIMAMLSGCTSSMVVYYIISFLLFATESLSLYKKFVKKVLGDVTLTKENKFFLYYQFVRFSFLNSQIGDDELGDLKDDLYYQINSSYKEEITEDVSFIPKEERNQKLVFVFIAQVLKDGHGPTKTLLDRCYILEKYLGKKVFIINTAEMLTDYEAIPYFYASCGNYIEEYNNFSTISYKDKTFDFFQCPKEMPNIDVINEIIKVVNSEKPYFSISIGPTLVADLCSAIVPNITIATVPSSHALTYSQFQSVGCKVTEADYKWIQKHNLPEDHIIESLFTSAFKEQTHHYTRKDLGLPEDRFIVELVGARLDDEIDDACKELIYKLTEAGLFVVFLGMFSRYQSFADENETFKINSKFLGFQDDILAVNECCDLYLNPKRVGGGTSAAEALYKGVPVVTFDYGDVGIGAGTDFHVDNYEDMYNHIIRYYEDKTLYQQMSEKARERAKRLTDSRYEFEKIIESAESSVYF